MNLFCGCSCNKFESLGATEGTQSFQREAGAWLAMAEAEARCREFFDAVLARITVVGFVFLFLAIVLVVGSLMVGGQMSLSLRLWT